MITLVIFGTTAELIFDINLIIQIILIVLLSIGVFQKRNWKYHGTIMAIGTLTILVTVLLIMAPSLIANWAAIVLAPTSPGVLITLTHVIIGLLALGIGLFFTIRFLYFSTTSKPLICGTRLQMRIQFTIWFLALIFGLAFYVFYYVI